MPYNYTQYVQPIIKRGKVFVKRKEMFSKEMACVYTVINWIYSATVLSWQTRCPACYKGTKGGGTVCQLNGINLKIRLSDKSKAMLI